MICSAQGGPSPWIDTLSVLSAKRQTIGHNLHTISSPQGFPPSLCRKSTGELYNSPVDCNKRLKSIFHGPSAPSPQPQAQSLPAAKPPVSAAIRAAERWVAVESEEVPPIVQFSAQAGNGTVGGTSELVERPQPTVNTPHDLKPRPQNIPLSRPAEYHQ